MGIYKPLNYDATMLIRLTTEMKDAFFAGCKARGVVPSEEARRLIVAQVLEQWGVDPNPKPAFERCEDTLEMFPAVPADEVEKPPVRPPQRPPAKEKEKTLVLLRYTMGKQMLAYFFCLALYYQAIQCQKRQFCLGSITKCDVIRTGGGFQRWGKKRPPKQYVICLANYRYCALGRCMVFRFLALGASANYPKRFARGGRNKRRQPCKS